MSNPKNRLKDKTNTLKNRYNWILFFIIDIYPQTTYRCLLTLSGHISFFYTTESFWSVLWVDILKRKKHTIKGDYGKYVPWGFCNEDYGVCKKGWVFTYVMNVKENPERCLDIPIYMSRFFLRFKGYPYPIWSLSQGKYSVSMVTVTDRDDTESRIVNTIRRKV